jgi:hypothetical protein
MPDPGDALFGVSLRQYATIIAGRDDGLPLDELLDFAEVEAKTWPRAHEAWSDRILEDVDADGPLAEALEAAMAEAQRGFIRRLPPLDEDLKAWLDFERAWSFEVDPAPFLERMRMRPSDITRLQALWAERLQGDQALAIRALTILTEEPGPVRAPEPEPTRIGPRARATTAHRDPRTSQGSRDLTLERYASLSVTLADYPDRAAQTLEAYRVTPEQKVALDAQWHARFAIEPELERAFHEACATYRGWLSRAGRTP